MAPVYTPNVALVELIFSLHGSVVENTLFFEAGATPDASQMLDLGTAVGTWWADEVAPFLSQEITLTRVDVSGQESLSSPGVSIPRIPADAGSVADNALPANCALCISFRTSLGGRSFRGRNYVAGVTEGNSGGSSIATANANGILSAYNALQSFVSANVLSESWQWVVVSKFSGGLPRASGVTTPITSAILVDYVVDSQRRRLPGRGR